MNPLASELLAGLFGAVSAAIPVWAIARRQPSRTVQDSVALVGVSRQIIDHLSSEVKRLETAVAAAEREAATATAKARDLEREANALRDRVSQLEQAVRLLGGDPKIIVSDPGDR